MNTKYIIAAIILLIAAAAIGIAVFMGASVKIPKDIQLEKADEEIENILYYASLAPNSHNIQSLKIEVNTSENIITIDIDKERTLDVVDSENRELYISLGCYLETLKEAFNAYGYDTSSDINENGTVQVTYNKSSDSYSEEMLDIIKKRHTDKSKYNSQALSGDTISSLLESSDKIFCYEKDSAEFEYLKEKTLEAVKKQSAMQSYRDELNLWMRFSDKEVMEKKDGITAEMIGLRGIVKSFYYLTTNHNNASSDKFAEQGITTAEGQVNNCGAFFVITGENTIKGWIDAGRETQAFWLRCAQNEIAVQPMSAVLETEPFKNSIQSDLGLDENVQMILRAGYVDAYGENALVRRDLSDYVTVTE